MLTLEMKQRALKDAQSSENNIGKFEMVNHAHNWKLVCHCQQLVEFSFSLYAWDSVNKAWRCNQSVTEQSADFFLRGIGVVSLVNNLTYV